MLHVLLPNIIILTLNSVYKITAKVVLVKTSPY